jgi:hypothetical protein
MASEIRMSAFKVAVSEAAIALEVTEDEYLTALLNMAYFAQERMAAKRRNLERVEICGVSTGEGPCGLATGHPVGPMFPGESGHMALEPVGRTT